MYKRQVLGITGKTLDDWVANRGADKVFEHSIYVTPGGPDMGVDEIVVLGSGSKKYFEYSDRADDAQINDPVRTSLDTLEKMQFCEADLINGKVSELLGSAYILIKGERLPPAP